MMPPYQKLLFVFIDDSAFKSARLYIDIADKKRNLIVRIERVPKSGCKRIYVFVPKPNALRFALKARKRAAVAPVSMDKAALACKRRIVREGVPFAGFGISASAL